MSLPAPSSSALFSPSFLVTGKSLQLQLSRTPPLQLSTRKIYNPTYFFNETYQHEIANHYRDYKRRSRLPRRRRHTIYVPYRRAAFYGVVSGERRPVLPMAVHDFPRFAAVYTTPRGRQTLCEGAPPDETYNATVRRIRQAKSCKELRVLVERQLRWSKHTKCNANANSSERDRVVKRRPKSATRVVGLSSRKAAKCATFGESKCEKSSKQQTNNDTDVNAQLAVANANEKWCHFNDNVDDSNANESVKKIKANVLRLSLSKQLEKDKQQTNKKQLKLRQAQSNALASECYKETLCSLAATAVSTTERKNNCQLSVKERNLLNSTEYFLQLASDYYEQGFLRNINYLQAIGTRNAAARSDKLATKRPTSCSSNDESVTATATATPTTSATNTPRLRSAEHFFRLTYLLQRIGHKRSFKLGSCARQAQFISSSRTTNTATTKSFCHNPCAIRVQIKPNAGEAPKATRQPAAAQSTALQFDGCSMNDYYLNVNTPTTISTTNTVEQNIANTVATRAHFHELIAHLRQLEISDIDASLPKITLTDCSTHGDGVDEAAVVAHTTTTAQTNDNAFAFEFDSACSSNNFSECNAFHSQLDKQQQQKQKQQQQQLQNTARRSGFTLRETKFGAVGLHASLEIPDDVYYSSEVRPT